MKRLTLNQAVAIVSGFGYAVLMEANQEQRTRGYDWLVCIKAGDNSIVANYALTAEDARKFRLFKPVIRKRDYAHGQAIWLSL